MGLLVEGKWHDKWYDTSKSGGKFERQESQFRSWIEDTPDARFKPESGRYHLYVSLACPWAHRTLIFRQLKSLAPHIDVSVVHPDMLANGWTFETCDGADGDKLHGYQYAHQIYTSVDPNITTRVTVPILWDKKEQTIVSNESAEIIRMFNSAFNNLTGNKVDYYPAEMRSDIDAINERIYHTVNNGVYKSGFATTQSAYEEAVIPLFETLDYLETRLEHNRYLMGDAITEADWRLFTTLIRFDPVYVGHFKCNIRTIESYTNLFNYMKELYQITGIADTVNMTHIKRHYYYSHHSINPSRVVPVGPVQDLFTPHNRAKTAP